MVYLLLLGWVVAPLGAVVLAVVVADDLNVNFDAKNDVLRGLDPLSGGRVAQSDGLFSAKPLEQA